MNNYMLRDECWEWKGARTRSARHGYGWKRFRGGGKLTHRIAYEWANGPIPEDMFVLHKCDNPPCCNPAHLFLGTMKDNMQDMASKDRAISDFCKRGHPRTPENVRETTDKRGRRQRECRVCVRERAQHKSAKRKEYMRNYYQTVVKPKEQRRRARKRAQAQEGNRPLGYVEVEGETLEQEARGWQRGSDIEDDVRAERYTPYCGREES